MRMFFIAVGILAWVWALAVLWIFAESGGALTVIAAGVFAIVAIVALGCERILKILEEIRDGRVVRSKAASTRITGPASTEIVGARPILKDRPALKDSPAPAPAPL